MPAEDIDYKNLSGQNGLSKRIETPLSDEYNYLREAFDRGSIHAACRSVFANAKYDVGNLHCFYFGFTRSAKDVTLWKQTYNMLHNRVLLLEEMLYVAKVMYSIESITLTSVSLTKHRLISKQLMKNLYKNPKDPNLEVNNHTLTESKSY